MKVTINKKALLRFCSYFFITLFINAIMPTLLDMGLVYQKYFYSLIVHNTILIAGGMCLGFSWVKIFKDA